MIRGKYKKKTPKDVPEQHQRGATANVPSQTTAESRTNLRTAADQVFSFSQILGRRVSHRGARVEYAVQWTSESNLPTEDKKGKHKKKNDEAEKKVPSSRRGGESACITWEPRTNLLAPLAGRKRTHSGSTSDSSSSENGEAEPSTMAATAGAGVFRNTRKELFAIDVGHKLRLDDEIANLFGVDDWVSEVLGASGNPRSRGRPLSNASTDAKGVAGSAQTTTQGGAASSSADDASSSSSDKEGEATAGEAAAKKAWVLIGDSADAPLLVSADYHSRCTTRLASIANLKKRLAVGDVGRQPAQTGQSNRRSTRPSAVRSILGADQHIAVPVIAVPQQRACADSNVSASSATTNVGSATTTGGPLPHTLLLPLGDHGSFTDVGANGESVNERLLEAVPIKAGNPNSSGAGGDPFAFNYAPPANLDDVMATRGQKVGVLYSSIKPSILRTMDGLAKALVRYDREVERRRLAAREGGDASAVPPPSQQQFPSTFEYYTVLNVLMQKVFGSSEDIRAAIHGGISHTASYVRALPSKNNTTSAAALAEATQRSSSATAAGPSVLPPSWLLWTRSANDVLRAAHYVGRLGGDDLPPLASASAAHLCPLASACPIEIYGIQRTAIHFEDTSSSDDESEGGVEDDNSASEDGSDSDNETDGHCSNRHHFASSISFDYNVRTPRIVLGEEASDGTDDDEAIAKAADEITFDFNTSADEAVGSTGSRKPNRWKRTVTKNKKRSRELGFSWVGESDALPDRAAAGNNVLFYIHNDRHALEQTSGEASVASALSGMTTTQLSAGVPPRVNTTQRRHDEARPLGALPTSPVSLQSLPLEVFRVLFPQQLLDFLLKNSLVLS